MPLQDDLSCGNLLWVDLPLNDLNSIIISSEMAINFIMK